MTYRVAIAGAGGIAEAHLKALANMDRLQAVAVADIAEERVRNIAEQYGVKAYTDYKRMVAEEKPDITVIALPHFLHKEASVYCAQQGSHLMLEKPMALDVAECDEIIRAVRAAGVRCLVGHTQHYIAENIKAKQIIDSGELGQLVMINDVRHVNYFGAARPGWFLEKAKAGGGILTNLGSHSIDKICWLSGGQVTNVKAALSHFAPRGDVEGSGLVFLETDIGVPATIAQSGYPGANRHETEFIFTGGMLKVVTSVSLWISKGGPYEQVDVPKVETPFVLQFNDLIHSIEAGEEPGCTMEYSRSVISVLESIYRSHESGREETVRK